MGDYFKPWRRKIGVVTLVTACVFAAGWVRSFSIRDEFSARRASGITSHLISNRARLSWKTVTIDDPVSIKFDISPYFARPAEKEAIALFRGGNVQWKWHREFLGFEFGRFIPIGPDWTEDICIVPYWSIVIPLTLLSAWLLLSKPRQPKAKPKATDDKYIRLGKSATDSLS